MTDIKYMLKLYCNESNPCHLIVICCYIKSKGDRQLEKVKLAHRKAAGEGTVFIKIETT